MPRFPFLLTLACCWFLAPGLATAQHAFEGRVLDASLAPVVGARVTATPERPGPAASTVTGRLGEFRVWLDAGSYSLVIEAPGFIDITERVVPALQGGAGRTFILQVAGVAETVRVQAPAGRVTSVRSAMKVPTPLSAVPQAISVVSSALIADQRMQSMADVVRYMPGVGMAQGEGNRDTPILRGNTSTSDFFVDGVRDDAQYLRDTYNVDHVEALKGPSAMIFGRGGGGGVINRVTRQAQWDGSREVDVQLGSWANRRLSADWGGGLSPSVAARVTGVYENSGSYRNGVDVERVGVNPTAAFALGPQTTFRASYEYFRDTRTADRGVSSADGRPAAAGPSTFFGDPGRSTSDVSVHLVSGVLERAFGAGANLRSRVTYGRYAKFYANVYPGVTDVLRDAVSLSAYDHTAGRDNVFSQTDFVITRRTGPLTHVVLAGVEVGRQASDNFRRTGYFVSLGPGVTAAWAPLAAPTVSLPVEFRPRAADADNRSVATVAAVYAQDQVTLTETLQAVVGVRLEHFEVDAWNRRTGERLDSRDRLVAPRVGLIYTPARPVSVYANYSLAYQPRAGDQLASLSVTNRALEPEVFRNREVGARWDVSPALSVSLAAYRLDRGNIAVADPLDPTRSVLVDGQRTRGIEAGVDGRLASRWTLVGGYAYQDGQITRSLSASAKAGAALAQLPRHSFSAWNKVDLSSQWSVGVGLVSREAMFAATDNLVVLPGFARVDAAAFWRVRPRLRLQVNVENVTNTRYYASAHNNTNILPGSPRAIRVALTSRF